MSSLILPRGSRTKKLLIALPSKDTWMANFGMDLLQMIIYLGQYDVEVRCMNHKSSTLPRSREWLCAKALEHGCDFILFIDDDQTFAPDTAAMLISRDLDIVAANVAVKQFPCSPTARAYNGTRSGAYLYTTPKKTGVEKVWRVGTGIMLIKTSALLRIPRPWFDAKWVDEDNYMGEDWAFIEKAEEAGIEAYIDHDVSQHVGHLGVFEFKHEHIEEPEDESLRSVEAQQAIN